MGGGMSSGQGVEDLIATTYMLGKAIQAITFPGMYRIYDFHSSKAPKLKNAKPFSFIGADSDEEEVEADVPDPKNYEHFFHVTVGPDVVYLEDVGAFNDGGWTALHTCCMSVQSATAAYEIIDEMKKCDCNFDVKTVAGPGTFNAGWTPLHMAAAYGVEPIVDKLIDAGADVNTENSFGYTPLLEATHRGFAEIVKALLKSNANINHLPSCEAAAMSPFVSAPAQAPLAEAARCGFNSIVQLLLDAGADKEQVNHRIGWNALHEACFHNRMEIVKMLLLSGCDATVRTKMGALPYHLCGLNALRAMIEEMGKEGSVPNANDKIDILAVMQELTSNGGGNGGQQVVSMGGIGSMGQGQGQFIVMMGGGGEPNDDDEEEDDDDERFMMETMKYMRLGDGEGDSKQDEIMRVDHANTAEEVGESKTMETPTKPKEAKEGNSSDKMLHSGGVLGDLPSLATPGSGTRGNWSGNDGARLEAVIDNGGSPTADASAVFCRNDGGKVMKKKKKKAKKHQHAQALDGFPQKYMCELCQRPMSDPVKSLYGHIYERSVILDWFAKQGRICPLTGAPLSENDIKDMAELKEEITAFILAKSQEPAAAPVATAVSTIDKEAKTGYSKQEEDLYDF